MSGAETTRPAAPACYCDGAGPCGACRWGLAPAAEVPTVPAPGPCQRAALVAALLRRDAAVFDIARLRAGLTAAEFSGAVDDYQVERRRLRAMRTAD